MSTTSVITPMAMPLIARRTRAYFAPVNRATSTPTIFDPAISGAWSSDAPPTPWTDLGWINGFSRSADSKVTEVATGMPATARLQARQSLGATVTFRFACWSKLTMALSAGSEHMNVLAPLGMVPSIGSGAKAKPAVALAANSDASTLYLAAPAALSLQPGSMVVVDQDYAGQTGFVGAPVSSAYVLNATAVGNDPDYLRRVSFNVGRVVSVGSDGGLKLATPLIAGTPLAAMKLQQVVGFVDREGGSFFQEWSGLFVMTGVQGDCLFLHYPRLQACQPSQEEVSATAPLLQMVAPAGKFRALPVTDGNDNQQVLCYRTYIPALSTLI